MTLSFRHLLLLALLLVLATQAGAVLAGITPLLSGQLVDGDCYVRLARVEVLLGGQGWYDSSVRLLNPPDGETLHWTRPLDLLIALPALPLSLIFGLKFAVWQAGLWISPLLEVAATAALIWGLRPHLPPRAILLAVVLFVLQPSIIGVFLPARPDHHSLQIALEIAVLAGLARPDLRSAELAGLFAALALWVGGEALPLILAAGLALGLSWVIAGGKEAQRLIHFTATLALGTTLALTIERPLAEWLVVEYDRLSLMQVGLCWILLLSCLWTAEGNGWAKTWRQRLLLCLGMAVQSAGLLAMLFPHFFSGPYGSIDPRLVPVWFSMVKEAQPLAFGPKAVVLTFPPLMGLGYALWRLRQGPAIAERRLLLAALSALLVYLPATLYQVRVAAFAVAADVMPWTLLILAAMHLGRLRVLLVPLLLTGHLVLAAMVSKLGLGIRDPGAPNVCSWNLLARHLDTILPGDRRPILTYIFPGPELGYLSGHAVVAGPYHRNTQGILDIVNALGGADDVPAREVVQRRGIGLVAVCDRESEGLLFDQQAGTYGFHAKLLRGNTPAWLKGLGGLHTAKGNFMIYEVVR